MQFKKENPFHIFVFTSTNNLIFGTKKCHQNLQQQYQQKPINLLDK